MSIVFFGTPHFAVPCLSALIDSKESISLVISQPDRRSGRGKKVSVPPVKAFAGEHGLTVLQPETLSEPGFLQKLRDISPEFIVVVAYGRILRKDILDLPVLGCINVHASLLPKYRGAAPIQWAIINGESITGITTMLMDEGMDTGDILLQKQISIANDDTTESLSARLSAVGAALLIETIQGMRKGSVKKQPQSGPVSYADMLKKNDGRIDWNRDAASIFNFVRGMYPWPCAYTYFDGKYVKILYAELAEGTGTPGAIIGLRKGRILVGTGKGLLSIVTLQPEGKKPIRSDAFINGYRLRVGDQFD